MLLVSLLNWFMFEIPSICIHVCLCLCFVLFVCFIFFISLIIDIAICSSDLVGNHLI